MCIVLLPPGGNPIAVKYIITYHIFEHPVIYGNYTYSSQSELQN